MFAALFATPAFAQGPSPLAAPNVPVFVAGIVAAVVREPDGSIVLGGRFTAVDGVPRSNIARLRADGTLDSQWNPSADRDVRVLAVNTAGDVYAGGWFTEIGGQARKGLAKLSGVGGAADADWNAGNEIIDVVALAPDTNGALFVGGQVNLADGTYRNVVKLSGSTGAMDTLWAPPLNPLAPVAAVAIDAGAVYVSAYGWDANCHICKFSGSATGDAVADWQSAVSDASVVLADVLAVGADGSLYAGGSFVDANGAPLALVKFPPAGHGAIDRHWNGPSFGVTTALAVEGATGAIYASGDFGTVKLSETSGAVEWHVATTSVWSMALGTDESLYLGGIFETVGEARQPAIGFARLARSDGASLPSSNVGLPGSVMAIARQSNGGTIIGGYFRLAGALQRRNLLRLAADGRLDPNWNPSFTETVTAVAVDADDNVYAGGYGNGTYRGALVKLATTSGGTAVPDWNVSVNGTVSTIVIDPEGAAYVGGGFGEIAGMARLGLAKLSLSDGRPDPAWNPSANGPVQAIAIDAAHGVYAGGDFQIIGGQPRPSIAKLSSTTGLADPDWNPPAADLINALALAPDGSLYAGGLYASDNPPTHSIMKLDNAGAPVIGWNVRDDGRTTHALVVGTDGSVLAGGSSAVDDHTPTSSFLTRLSGDNGATVPGWNPEPDGSVISALLADSAGVWVGGDFTMIGGQPRGGLAALPTPPVPPSLPILQHSRRPKPILPGSNHR